MSLTERFSGLMRRRVLSDVTSSAPRDGFLAWAAKLGPAATVLEIGTKRWVDGVSTHLQGMFPGVPRQAYVMADIQPGDDVDVVADLHALPADWTGRFDAVVATAVFEHLERPWIAAHEIARILKPGGRCYVSTHQTYPLHGYPADYFRFSRGALSLLFEDAGLTVQNCAYEHRTWIRLPRALVPRRLGKRGFVDTWNRIQPAYLVVHLSGCKPG